MTAPHFPAPGGGGRPPTQPSPAARLATGALALLNRVVAKDPGKVVLHSSVDVEDGILAVAEELVARGRRPVFLLQERSRAAAVRSLAPGHSRLVSKRSVAGLWQYLTAAHVMTTHNVFGNRTPPPAQRVVSLWHGEPPTKVVARFEGQGGLNSSYAPVCSTLARAYRAAEFDLHPLQVPIVGAPRNDRMLRADPVAVRRALLGDDAGRPAVLWMPSFRSGRWSGDRAREDVAGREPGGFPYGPDELRQLDDWLVQRGALVVLKLHPRDAAQFPQGLRALRELTYAQLEANGLTLYAALSAFDALVTDMSSIWLDYLLLDKPMVFAFPDLDNYRNGRGLNLEPYEDWVPGPLVRPMDELVGALDDVVAGRDPMREERGRARLRFHRYHDAGSSARLLDGLGLR